MLDQTNAEVIRRVARFNDLTGLNFAGLVRLSFELNPNAERTEVPLTGRDINNRDEQEVDCRKSVASRGGEYVHTYDEPDTSAWKRKKVRLPDGQIGYRVVRPVFEQALKDLKAGVAPNGQRLDGLIVYDIDRLVREHRYLEDAIDTVMYFGRPIIDITGTLDLLTDNGRDMARVLVTMAGKQSTATSRRVSRKHYAMAIRGIPVGGSSPFGWMDDKRTKHPINAGLLENAAKDVIAGIGLHTICREWKEAGVKTARGNTVVPTVLRKMLKSARLAGYRMYQGKVMLDGAGKPVKGQYEPILDLQTWEAVKAVLTDPERSGNHVHRGGRKYLLSGNIVCGLCSRQLTGNADNRYNNFNYVCPPPTSGAGCGGVSANGPHVDKLVTELVLRYLSERTVQRDVKPWSGERDLADASQQVADLMTAYRNKELPSSLVFPQVKELQATVDSLQARKTEWHRRKAAGLNAPSSNIVELWPDLSIDRQRAVIDSLGIVIVVNPATKSRNRFDPNRVEVIFRQ